MSSEDESNERQRATKQVQEGPEEEEKRFERMRISTPQKMPSENAVTHDQVIALRSELAAVEYKRDRSIAELQEMKSLLRLREKKLVELQIEIDQLREQAARQNSIIFSLKKRIQELEDRERNLYAVQGRQELTIQSLERDLKYQEGKAREYEQNIRQLEENISEEMQMKERAHLNLQEFARRLALALGAEFCEKAYRTPDLLIHKADELVQDVNRLRTKTIASEAQISSIEHDFRSCKDGLERSLAEKEQLHRQLSGQSLELERMRQDKECLGLQNKLVEKELSDYREKLLNANRSISSATDNMSSQETLISQLREEVNCREEKMQRAQTENRQFLESLAVIIGGAESFMVAEENALKDRIKHILDERNNQALKIEELREKFNVANQSATRQSELAEGRMAKIRTLEALCSNLEVKVRKLESDLASCQLSKESLRRDRETLTCFLDRLARAMQIDELSQDVGLDLQMESILLRAGQMARLETDKLVDKTSVVYQLQRRVKTLREQLQRRDFHLDLLRRKLSLQEDSVRIKSLLQSERDEANSRFKKLVKDMERIQNQLADEKVRNRELSTQLTETADHKITALERARKIEDLQKRLVESEMLRTRCNRKLSMLKDQMRSTTETVEQERSITDHALQLVRDELTETKQNLSELTRRESQLQSFRLSVVKLLSEPVCTSDYEIISRLQKMVAAHRDLTMLSRRYEEPLDTNPSRCTSIHPGIHPPRSPGSRCTRYEDSGFADPPDLHEIDLQDVYNKRPIRSSLLP